MCLPTHAHTHIHIPIHACRAIPHAHADGWAVEERMKIQIMREEQSWMLTHLTSTIWTGMKELGDRCFSFSFIPFSMSLTFLLHSVSPNGKIL